MTKNELKEETDLLGETIIDMLIDSKLETQDSLIVMRNLTLALSGTYFEYHSGALIDNKELPEYITDYKNELENIINKFVEGETYVVYC